MPYYAYRCTSCGGDFELHLPVERRDEASCPRCGSDRVQRAVAPVYAIVRGSAPSAREEAPCRDGEECGGECACRCDN
jgi:putative FmdB family regulatory protein